MYDYYIDILFNDMDMRIALMKVSYFKILSVSWSIMYVDKTVIYLLIVDCLNYFIVIITVVPQQIIRYEISFNGLILFW